MKFGIIGAGGIAKNMAGTVSRMKNVDCTAIAARDIERARAYAEKYGFRKAYGSYEDLLADPEVELVYIALPHSFHCEWTVKALRAGKHVLCEKAFAASEAQAREMIALAEEKKLLLTEAMWTRYMPSRTLLAELLQSGEIGKIVGLTANLGYDIDANTRIIRPELAGGALLDLTVYPLNFASMI
ncbi:MAG: Gfo/Idh/MocA family oxidoreductase, partial [Oscillospiraceae bacterium]|nr:Gfo/Idh/MocA family oxidoreductase [Oscillospiraceae bacterium]